MNCSPIYLGRWRASSYELQINSENLGVFSRLERGYDQRNAREHRKIEMGRDIPTPAEIKRLVAAAAPGSSVPCFWWPRCVACVRANFAAFGGRTLT